MARRDRRAKIAGKGVLGAIIDIGSNTVRLVIYGGHPRAPSVLFNEKVTARLGRDLDENGLLSDAAIDLAMRGLERFALILRDLEVERVDTVATAAVRDATNGKEFLARVQSLGLEPRLLSGLDEATISAEGVLGAFPDARGIVADLGGGSLELVPVQHGAVHEGTSLPAGTLRLPSLGKGDPAKLRDRLKDMIRKNTPTMPESSDESGTLFLVGGTWRALATYARTRDGFPLTDPHGFSLTREDALSLARDLTKADVAKIKAMPRVSGSRAETLSDAAVLLQVLLKTFAPERIVVSAWGLREGLMMRRLSPPQLAQDPLLAAVVHFAEGRGASATTGARIVGWTVDTVHSPRPGAERLRLAATLLALAAMQTEPNLRLQQGVGWALHKRWPAITPAERAMLATAICANSNELDLPEDIAGLAPSEALEEAKTWGLGLRLARRLGAGSAASLDASRLTCEPEALVLTLSKSHAALYGQPTERDMALLAKHLGLEPEVRVQGEGAIGKKAEKPLLLETPAEA